MPEDVGKGKGKGGGTGGGSTRWDTDQLEWHQGLMLYIREAVLAKSVYDAIYTARNFRLVVDGTVICGIPEDTPGTHAATHVATWTSKDLDWDDAGCLVIKDKPLGERVVAAQKVGLFSILMSQDSITGGVDGGPIGGNLVNGMCAC